MPRTLNLFVVTLSVTSQVQADIVHSVEAAPPGLATATYVEATGEFIFSVGTGVPLIGVAAAAPDLLKQGLTPMLGTKNPDQYDSISLAYFDFNKGLPDGIFSQGPLFDPGLSEEFVTQNVSFSVDAPWCDCFGFPIDYLPIPEPRSVFFIAMVLLCIPELRCHHSRLFSP